MELPVAPSRRLVPSPSRCWGDPLLLLCSVVAAKLGGRHHDMHAPVLVEKPEVRNIFLSEPAVREGIRRAQVDG